MYLTPLSLVTLNSIQYAGRRCQALSRHGALGTPVWEGGAQAQGLHFLSLKTTYMYLRSKGSLISEINLKNKHTALLHLASVFSKC